MITASQSIHARGVLSLMLASMCRWRELVAVGAGRESAGDAAKKRMPVNRVMELTGLLRERDLL